MYTSNGIPHSINDPITIVDGITVNPLSLALYNGNLGDFRNIKENLGGKIRNMSLLLEKQGVSAFTIIFKHGHLDILKFFLPLYMLECDSKVSSIEELKKPLILTAVKYRHLNIVEFVYSYFKDVEPPYAFDLDCVDSASGDNAALVACKNLDLPMVVFLNEVCKVDFLVTNKYFENPLMVVGKCSQKSQDCFELVKYLLERVGVGTSFNYEGLLEEFEDNRVKDLIRDVFLGLNASFVSEAESRISNITAIGKRGDEDLTIGDLQMII